MVYTIAIHKKGGGSMYNFLKGVSKLLFQILVVLLGLFVIQFNSPVYTAIYIFAVVLIGKVVFHDPNPRRIAYTLSHIDNMDGFDFEKLVGNLYRALGYTATVTPESGDFGADVIAKNKKEKIAIQCKRYKDVVGIEAVYQVVGSLKYYGATKGVVISNSTYTDAAKKLAKANDIELIDRTGLIKLLAVYCKNVENMDNNCNTNIAPNIY